MITSRKIDSIVNMNLIEDQTNKSTTLSYEDSEIGDRSILFLTKSSAKIQEILTQNDDLDDKLQSTEPK